MIDDSTAAIVASVASGIVLWAAGRLLAKREAPVPRYLANVCNWAARISFGAATVFLALRLWN